ncbi:MAG: hypothetical protein V1736_05220 [Pseudomonadota bacterium]
MATFEEILHECRKCIAAFAAENWPEFKQAVMDDAEAFITSTKDDLERWSYQLLTGQLSKDDFEWLVRSKKDLAEMEALKRLGLAQVQLDSLVNGLIEVIIRSLI